MTYLMISFLLFLLLFLLTCLFIFYMSRTTHYNRIIVVQGGKNFTIAVYGSMHIIHPSLPDKIIPNGMPVLLCVIHYKKYHREEAVEKLVKKLRRKYFNSEIVIGEVPPCIG